MATPAPQLSDQALGQSCLLSYTAAQMPNYLCLPHLIKLADYLEAVEHGDITRLLVFMPPQHGKTQLASAMFPAWFLGRDPSRKVIFSSYNDDRAFDVGREVKNLVLDPVHRLIFPECRIAEDARASNRFSTLAHGAYFACGIGGSATGRGANLFLIDDPVKNREEADSAAVQRMHRSWYSSVVTTRMASRGAIILIMTQWNERDLGGWLKSERKNERWVELALPAFAGRHDPLKRKPGEPLAPEMFDKRELLAKKAVMLARDWNAMYMCTPIAPEGGLFKRENFKWYKQGTLPKALIKYGFSDYAVTEEQQGDDTEHGIFGLWKAPDGLRIYGIDWRTFHTEPDVWIDGQLDLVRRHHPQAWYGESGVIKKAVWPYLRRRMKDRGDFVNCRWLPSVVDKVSRSTIFQGIVSAGCFWLPEGEKWAADLVDQLCSFPGGKDDKVDVCSLAGRAIHQMIVKRDRAEENKGIKPFTTDWLFYEETKPKQRRF